MIVLPEEVCTLLQAYYTCEVTTVNTKGQPVTWPCLTYFHAAKGQIIFTASIAFRVKALNAQRHRQVSLLYSNPRGSGLIRPAAVLIQGMASVHELLNQFDPEMIALYKITQQRQPDTRKFSRNRLTRRLFTWYLFQRLVVAVTPQRVRLWPQGDFHADPVEVTDVE